MCLQQCVLVYKGFKIKSQINLNFSFRNLKIIKKMSQHHSKLLSLIFICIVCLKPLLFNFFNDVYYMSITVSEIKNSRDLVTKY